MRNVMLALQPGKEDADLAREDLEGQLDAGEAEEDQGFMSLVQNLEISPKALLGLTNAVNKVLPLFGLPSLKGKEITPDLIRSLTMIAQAITDAVGSDETPGELTFSIDDLQGGDQAVIVVAGKLDRLSKTPAFRKFLRTKPSTPSAQPPQGDQVAIDKTSEASTDIDKLFASRV